MASQYDQWFVGVVDVDLRSTTIHDLVLDMSLKKSYVYGYVGVQMGDLVSFNSRVIMQCCLKLPLLGDQLQNAVEIARDYAVSHGIVVRTKENPESAEVVTHAPFLLLPSPVPKQCYCDGVSVQTDFNLLMHKVAHDYEFLRDALQHTIKVDDFTRRLWNIYEMVRKEGISQPVSLGLNRSDYMFDCGQPSEVALKTGFSPSSCSLKQIEFNTMASSFAGLCCQLSEFHRMVAREIKCCSEKEMDANCPKNEAAEGIADGMIAAWEEYRNTDAAIMFLVFGNERNVYDQRFLEFAVRKKKPGVNVIRRTIQDLSVQGTLGKNNELLVDGNEVAVCYFRAGYTPNDFHDEKDWDSRLLLERSKAIKCPNVYYHLAGTKKVQQVLAKPGVVEKFISDSVAADRIRKTFAGQYSLDMGDEGDRSVSMAMENPHKFVLKPQREGGGNNIFGEEIRNLLAQIGDSEERTAYILMERINPAPLRNYALRSGSEVQLCDMVSELGIFGVVVGTKDTIIMNKQQGHILRTKTLGTDEGGVASGFAALDSPYLV